MALVGETRYAIPTTPITPDKPDNTKHAMSTTTTELIQEIHESLAVLLRGYYLYAIQSY